MIPVHTLLFLLLILTMVQISTVLDDDDDTVLSTSQLDTLFGKLDMLADIAKEQNPSTVPVHQPNIFDRARGVFIGLASPSVPMVTPRTELTNHANALDDPPFRPLEEGMIFGSTKHERTMDRLSSAKAKPDPRSVLFNTASTIAPTTGKSQELQFNPHTDTLDFVGPTSNTGRRRTKEGTTSKRLGNSLSTPFPAPFPTQPATVTPASAYQPAPAYQPASAMNVSTDEPLPYQSRSPSIATNTTPRYETPLSQPLRKSFLDPITALRTKVVDHSQVDTTPLVLNSTDGRLYARASATIMKRD